MNYAFLEPWSAFLPCEAGHVLGFSGSGGKTSLMRTLADHFVGRNLPVVLTTTTRSEPLDDVPEILHGCLPEDGALPPVVCVHAGRRSDGKLAGLEPGQVDDLRSLFPDRIILCEVDGAAKLPLKLYRDGEPRWPAATSLALVVMGAAAVGGAAGQRVHRLGRAGVTPAKLSSLPDHTVLQWSHLEEMLRGEGGYLDQVPQDIPVVMVLGGIDEVSDSIGLFGFAGRVMDDPRCPLLVFSGRAEDGPMLRTAYRSSEESEPAG